MFIIVAANYLIDFRVDNGLSYLTVSGTNLLRTSCLLNLLEIPGDALAVIGLCRLTDEIARLLC